MTKKHKKEKILAESETRMIETIAAQHLLFMTTRTRKSLTLKSISRKHALLKMKRSA